MTPRLTSSLLSLVLALGAGAAAADEPSGASGPARAEPLAVTGFAIGSVRPRVVRRDAGSLATVTVAGIGLSPDGSRVADPTADMERLRRVAHHEGLRTELLVSNYSNRQEDFDARAAHRLLASEQHRDEVAAGVAAHVADGGWDGVNVDLERIRAADAPGLVAFVAALQDALPASTPVSIDISAATSVRAYAARGYDLAGLAATADVIAVMTYDQHGPWSEAGAIGGLGWQRRALRALLREVPAGQVDLGVAGYGYTWPRTGTGRSVTAAGARRRAERAGVRPVWHPRVAEWSARLPSGTVVWWSDARSYQHRARLARRHDLHGVALWRLGSADPLR